MNKYREEREKHLSVLSDIMDSMPDDACGDWRDSIAYAISSIRTDLKYDLLYENEPIITLNELKEIREEITRFTSRYSLAKERSGMGQVEWSDYLLRERDVLKILDKKIAELEGKNNEN